MGDFFFVATALFFLRGFGVGVGVEKIFFSASPRDRSAAGDGTMVETITASAITIRINMRWFDGSECDFLERRLWQISHIR